MCFDVSSSLLAWSIIYSIGIYLYFRNQNADRWNAAFIMMFAIVQLLEAGLWTTLEDGKKPELNDLLTRLMLLTLISQPLIQSFMGYKYSKSELLGVMSWIFLGLLIWALVRVGFGRESGQFSSSPGPNGHLVWSDSKSPSFLGGWWVVVLYIIGLFVPLMFMYSNGEWKGAPFVVVGIVTAIFSILGSSKSEFSSYWCYTTVAYATVALFC